MGNISDKIKSKHILCSITFSENRALYELKWLKYGRAGQVKDDSLKVNVYLSSLMMKVPDHVYVLG
jgi:hypothetical protein